jgi:prepilin-type N-terminal cleavage/methylation domain-containing protein
MTGKSRRFCRSGERSECDHEGGFTLVELLVAIAALGIIAVPLSMSFITGIRFLGRSDQRFDDSRSALISAAYFASDVAGANAVVPGDTAACGGGAALVSFDSSDATLGVAAAVTNEVSYVYDTSITSNARLLRKYCVNGVSTTQSVAAVSLGSQPVVTCYDATNAANVGCANAHWVTLAVTQKVNKVNPDGSIPAAYSFTLEGTRRTP